jgi:hypothetical protein
MGTCQIEVMEFGQAMERPWVRNRLEAVIRPDSICICGCMCCPDENKAATNKAWEDAEEGKDPY